MGGYFWRDFYCFKGNLIGFNHKQSTAVMSSSAISPGNIAERDPPLSPRQLTLSDAPALLPAVDFAGLQARKDNSSRRLTATCSSCGSLLATTLNRVTADGVRLSLLMPVDARPGRYNRSWGIRLLRLFISVELFLHDVLRSKNRLIMSVLSCISPRLAS